MCTEDKSCVLHIMQRLADNLGSQLRVDADSRPCAHLKTDIFHADLRLREVSGLDGVLLTPELIIKCNGHEKLSVPRVAVIADTLETFSQHVTYVQALIDSSEDWVWSKAEVAELSDAYLAWKSSIMSGENPDGAVWANLHAPGIGEA